MATMLTVLFIITIALTIIKICETVFPSLSKAWAVGDNIKIASAIVAILIILGEITLYVLSAINPVGTMAFVMGIIAASFAGLGFIGRLATGKPFRALVNLVMMVLFIVAICLV